MTRRVTREIADFQDVSVKIKNFQKVCCPLDFSFVMMGSGVRIPLAAPDLHIRLDATGELPVLEAAKGNRIVVMHHDSC
jgi:hypothetical protein